MRRLKKTKMKMLKKESHWFLSVNLKKFIRKMKSNVNRVKNKLQETCGLQESRGRACLKKNRKRKMKLSYKLINKKKMIHLSRQMIMKILLKRMIMYLRQSKKLTKLSNSKSSKVKIRMQN